MPIIELTPTLNCPRVCDVADYAREILNGRKKAILNSNALNLDTTISESNIFDIDGCIISVSPRASHNGALGEDWLRTKLGPGINLYVLAHGGMSWLPTCMPLYWKTTTDNCSPEFNSSIDKDMQYVKVNYIDEKNFAEMCCNAYKYTFDPYKGEFFQHKNITWNLVKGLLRRYLVIVSGGTEERIADYGKLILFLLSKVNLTEEERNTINQVIEFSPDLDDLKDIIKREAFIQKFVAEAKKDPTAFLNWNQRWGSYWWNNSEDTIKETD